MLLQFKTSKDKTNTRSILVLAGDIGGTKTNLALYKVEGNDVTALKEAQYKSQEYNSLTQITDDFLKELQSPESVCIGVAGPVLNNQVNLTNLSWGIDAQEIANHMGVEKVHLLNDLEATAYGLAILNKKDIAIIHEGQAIEGNVAVIAPGTGLGEAGLYWDGNYYHPFATEGGHCDFAPRNEFDVELYFYLAKKFGRVSWERIICGPGIVNIYHFLRDEKKMEEPGWLKEELKNASSEAAVISKHVNQSEICNETMQLFVRYLAQESANLILKLKATGGLFIGGGIAPQIVDLFENQAFQTAFSKSGRLSPLLEQVPVKIILNTKAALLGAAFYGAKIS